MKPRLKKHYWILVDDEGTVDAFSFFRTPTLYNSSDAAAKNAVSTERPVKVHIVVEDKL